MALNHLHPATRDLWFAGPTLVQELQAKVCELQTSLQEANNEIARLKAEINANHFSQMAVPVSERSWLTMAEVAKLEGVSLATVSRYLNADWWHGKKVGKPYKWQIDANQSFRRKSRRAA